jgi:hypothetical protein
MLITGKGGTVPEPAPRTFTADQLACLGRMLVQAVRGDLKALAEIERLLAAARRAWLTPAETELMGRLEAEPQPSKLPAQEIAAEAAWPDDILRALIALGDLPESYGERSQADAC